MCKHLMAAGKLDPEHRARQNRGNFTFHLNRFFFAFFDWLSGRAKTAVFTTGRTAGSIWTRRHREILENTEDMNGKSLRRRDR